MDVINLEEYCPTLLQELMPTMQTKTPVELSQTALAEYRSLTNIEGKYCKIPSMMGNEVFRLDRFNYGSGTEEQDSTYQSVTYFNSMYYGPWSDELGGKYDKPKLASIMIVHSYYVDNNLQSTENNDYQVIYREITLQDNTALQNFCPLIEDTRTAAVSEITGVAPFATLQDGQRVLLKLVYNSGSNSTLNLTLSDGTTTGAIPVYVMTFNVANRQLADADARAGGYIELVYNESGNRWQMVGYKDMNTTYNTTNSTAIKQGTLTVGYLVSPAVLRECFYLKSEIDNTIGGIETILQSI